MSASHGCIKRMRKNRHFHQNFQKHLSAIAVIPLTVNKIASSGGLVRYSRRFRYSGRRYRRRTLYVPNTAFHII